MEHDLVVIGAGPAGLAQAFWHLQANPNAEVRILEAADRPGGWVNTIHDSGYQFEAGPQAIRPCPEFEAMIKALDLSNKLVPAADAASQRWLGRGGKLIGLPAGPGDFFTSKFLSLGAKLRLFCEPFIGKRKATEDESVASFVGRRLGKSTEPLVHAMISGIFAGNASELEVKSAFPFLQEAEAEHGSLFKGMKARRKTAPKKQLKSSLYSLGNGMQGIIDAIITSLGDRLDLATPATAINREGDHWRITTPNGDVITRQLICATPANATARMLQELDPELAQHLEATSFASLASVYLGFPSDQATERLQGFGFLLEPGENSPVLGGIYCSSLFPDHAPKGHSLVRIMLGGVRHPETVDLSDEELVAQASQALRAYTGFEGTIDFTRIMRVRSAIPQYVKGHQKHLSAIRTRVDQHAGLSLAGNSYNAIALGPQLGHSA